MQVGSKKWMENFQEVVNADQELNVIGKYCVADLLLQIGSKEYIVQIKQGKLTNFFEKGALDGWSFAIRGSLEAWEKFTQPTPPPMFHELFAAVFQGNLQLEGNLKELYANLRYMIRFLDVTREVKNLLVKGV
ncbi:hypothetical protein M4D55_09935 [Metabacillus idriensis]|uniref:SCP2 domain-containing protein n=1 Tax=Metabacillus idriensis TaxID=324768 RepID=A0A6I2ME92_9BACI|nr:hypothetical protein [Metabacillus idriensis]MCM3596094.1 hypothetical protein [Metabacillus idriensis]MRX56059.1 hypothetical protein [Metabacillus idriensis]OHR72666.1 hypothetical protein HMPREF3291_05940 [Bacillus sp. HMSC76G11]